MLPSFLCGLHQYERHDFCVLVYIHYTCSSTTLPVNVIRCNFLSHILSFGVELWLYFFQVKDWKKCKESHTKLHNGKYHLEYSKADVRLFLKLEFV